MRKTDPQTSAPAAAVRLMAESLALEPQAPERLLRAACSRSFAPARAAGGTS